MTVPTCPDTRSPTVAGALPGTPGHPNNFAGPFCVIHLARNSSRAEFLAQSHDLCAKVQISRPQPAIAFDDADDTGKAIRPSGPEPPNPPPAGRSSLARRHLLQFPRLRLGDRAVGVTGADGLLGESSQSAGKKTKRHAPGSDNVKRHARLISS